MPYVLRLRWSLAAVPRAEHRPGNGRLSQSPEHPGPGRLGLAGRRERPAARRRRERAVPGAPAKVVEHLLREAPLELEGGFGTTPTEPATTVGRSNERISTLHATHADCAESTGTHQQHTSGREEKTHAGVAGPCGPRGDVGSRIARTQQRPHWRGREASFFPASWGAIACTPRGCVDGGGRVGDRKCVGN